jgi:ABC-type Mn2+/Zn2+ transport system ATPase subunit
VAGVLAMTIERSPWRRLPATERAGIADTLERLGLGSLAGRPLASLSGGERQRVFIARALVRHPDLLVLDEPAAGIDTRSRVELLDLLAELHAAGQAILFTSHDLNAIAARVPRLVCFNRTVVADGPPVEVLHPYVLERTFGAMMQVLSYGDRPIVVDGERRR